MKSNQNEICLVYSYQELYGKEPGCHESHHHHVKWYENKDSTSLLTTRFRILFYLAFVFGIFQLGISYYANSLSLINFSIHQIVDYAFILLCYFSVKIGQRKSNAKFNFGYHRFEIIGAIVCNIILATVMFFLFIFSVREAINNYFQVQKQEDEKINSKLMFIGSALGLTGDLLSLYFLKYNKKLVKYLKNTHNCC